MDEDERSGWNVDLVVWKGSPQVRQQLQCPVCLQIMKDAVQCPNQHACCQVCRSKCRFCPICKNKKSPVPSLLMRQLIDQLEIRCSGCDSMFKIDQIQNHEASCPKVKVPCKNSASGCQLRIPREELSKHAMSSCPYQVVRCSVCQIEIFRHESATHSCLESMMKLTRKMAQSMEQLAEKNSQLERRVKNDESEKSMLQLRIQELSMSARSDIHSYSDADEHTHEISRKRKKHVPTVEYLAVSHKPSIPPQIVPRPVLDATHPHALTSQQQLLGNNTDPHHDHQQLQLQELQRLQNETHARMNLFVVGGYDGCCGLTSMEKFDGRKWTTSTVSTSKSRKCTDFATAVCDGRPYVCGGRNGNTFLKSVDMFESNRWVPQPNMTCKRAYFGLAVLNNTLYAMGGNNGRDNLDSTEALMGSKWVICSSHRLNVKRSCFGTATYKDAIYVCGGTHGSETLSSVERYTPETGWTMAPSMLTHRSNVACVTFGEYLYVIGGTDHLGEAVPTVERFDGTSWIEVGSLITKRSSSAACVAFGHIYVLGGYNASVGLLESVERFDGFVWSLTFPMETRRVSCGAFTLRLDTSASVSEIPQGSLRTTQTHSNSNNVGSSSSSNIHTPRQQALLTPTQPKPVFAPLRKTYL